MLDLHLADYVGLASCCTRLLLVAMWLLLHVAVLCDTGLACYCMLLHVTACYCMLLHVTACCYCCCSDSLPTRDTVKAVSSKIRQHAHELTFLTFAGQRDVVCFRVICFNTAFEGSQCNIDTMHQLHWQLFSHRKGTCSILSLNFPSIYQEKIRPHLSASI